MSTWFLGALVLLCVFTILAMLIAALVPRPKDEPNPADKITGMVTPVIMALLAGALYGQNRSMNGRLNELQELGERHALKRGRESALQGMMWRLQQLDPGSTEYHVLADQVLQETLLQNGVVDRRRTNGVSTDRKVSE